MLHKSGYGYLEADLGECPFCNQKKAQLVAGLFHAWRAGTSFTAFVFGGRGDSIAPSNARQQIYAMYV